MKELDFIEIIKNTLSAHSHIGDDCAFLDELGIVITQDSLVEDIHFSTGFSTPYQLGYKAIVVNISDIFSSGAKPKYVTISLSIPSDTPNSFIKEFYQACNDLAGEFGIEVIGGDITGSDKIFVSVCAIGVTKGRNIASRSYAKVGDYVITTGIHGSSVAGLWLLNNPSVNCKKLVNVHLMPNIKQNFSKEIATKVQRQYAMMDTSDGLADALFKVAQSSGVSISVNFDKIPYDKEIEQIAKSANVDFRDWILFGGEDFQLVACIDKENLKNINADYTIIGQVNEKTKNSVLEINYGDRIQHIDNLDKTFNHFKEQK